MNAAIRQALEKYGAFSVKDPVAVDENSNFGELLVWTAVRVAASQYFKQVGVVDVEYTHAKYPHAVVVPQDVAAERFTNRSDMITYPVHVIIRVLDSNPFRGVRAVAALNTAIMKMLRRTPDVEPLSLPDRDSVLHDIKVMSAPVLPSGRENNEYESTIRVEYMIKEPRLNEDKYGY